MVDGLAGDEGRLRILDDELARLDPDARLQPELDHGLPHRQGRTGCALGVVLMGLRDAERGENGVACELLHDPAVDRHAVRHGLEEPVDPPPDDLGVAPGDDARRVDEVDEQHRCELSLHAAAGLHT